MKARRKIERKQGEPRRLRDQATKVGRKKSEEIKEGRNKDERKKPESEGRRSQGRK